ncbi:hypothetical protein [Noviherbaspirillum galbum]|uniref:Uncharacterized protein n=1 Tax=Noviherbaspirillum galbum TaxID=2709383 RepID=A0A6B3SMX8_9BURK|nr:hypothetical protein [Noviherbaspirillum galbum]NEX62103.1 hypothetical protein [Noviherbaspirillum galbum]
MSNLRIRLALCLALLGGLAAFLAREFVPGVPLVTILGVAVPIALAIGLLLVAAILVEGAFNSWTFRHGGMDAQWLWFRHDPPGAERLRRQMRGTPPARGDAGD